MTALTSHPGTDFTKSEYILYVTIKEFAFSHAKVTSSLKEYFQALEMDKMHIYYICGISILGVISMTSSFSSDAKTIWATC